MQPNKKHQLEKKLRSIFDIIYDKNELREKIQKEMFESHEVLPGTTNMVLLGMKEVSEITIEELVWYTKAIIIILENSEDKELVENLELTSYFTNSELTSFSNSKKNIEFNDASQILIEQVNVVNDDQWITVKDVNFLKMLYDLQKINYNRNTQRNLTLKKLASYNYYTITIKEKSVKEIMELLSKRLFIPNVITLNLNMDNEEIDFEVVDDEMLLKSGRFDIIDGYHRFRAAMRLKTLNPDFNYPFIINIVNFSEEKAKLFIAQEDKRNKMPKDYSQSLDSTRLANIVVNRLNEDSSCYLYGNIDKLGAGLIDFTQLANIIHYNFKMTDTKDTIRITNYLKKAFNELLSADDTLLDTHISFKTLCVIIRIFYLCYNKDTNIAKLTLKCLKKIDTLEDIKFKKNLVKKVIFNDIDTLVKGVDKNV